MSATVKIEPVLRSSECGDCPIRHKAVCSRCEGDDLRRLEEMKFYRTFEAGQPILFAGDRMEFVASVVAGVASLSQTMEDGRTQMLGLLLPSDFIGRPGRDTVTFDATAVTDVVVCCFRRRPFEELLAATPALNQRLLEMALDELDAARDWMLLLGRKTAREKIATLMAIIARRTIDTRMAAEAGVTFNLPLTREAMADYLGLTLETVSRQISALKTDNVIRLKDRRVITIPSYDRLLEETGTEDGSFRI